MKTALAILLASVLAASAGNVRFNLRDFIQTSQTLARRTVIVYPQSAPQSSGTNIVLTETRSFMTGTNGAFTATNMVEGTYRCVVKAYDKDHVFRVNVPSFSGETNASYLLISAADNGLETEDGRSIDIE